MDGPCVESLMSIRCLILGCMSCQDRSQAILKILEGGCYVGGNVICSWLVNSVVEGSSLLNHIAGLNTSYSVVRSPPVTMTSRSSQLIDTPFLPLQKLCGCRRLGYFCTQRLLEQYALLVWLQATVRMGGYTAAFCCCAANPNALADNRSYPAFVRLSYFLPKN
jgi:hypothetical protein